MIFSLLLGASILIIVGFLVVANWQIVQKRAEYDATLRDLVEQKQLLETKRLELQTQISQTDQESYLEEQARERFNLKKSGEEVVAILPAEGEEGEGIEKGFWGKLLDKLKFW